MPIYAYRCTSCGHAKDVLQKVSDPLLTDCPACGAATFVKQVTAAGFQLKGSGWYVTDFRGGNNVAPAKPDGEAGGKPAEKVGEKTGDKASESAATKSADQTGGKPPEKPTGGGGEKAASAPAAPAPAPAASPPAAGPPPAAGG